MENRHFENEQTGPEEQHGTVLSPRSSCLLAQLPTNLSSQPSVTKSFLKLHPISCITVGFS